MHIRRDETIKRAARRQTLDDRTRGKEEWVVKEEEKLGEKREKTGVVRAPRKTVSPSLLESLLSGEDVRTDTIQIWVKDAERKKESTEWAQSRRDCKKLAGHLVSPTCANEKQRKVQRERHIGLFWGRFFGMCSVVSVLVCLFCLLATDFFGEKGDLGDPRYIQSLFSLCLPFVSSVIRLKGN